MHRMTIAIGTILHWNSKRFLKNCKKESGYFLPRPVDKLRDFPMLAITVAFSDRCACTTAHVYSFWLNVWYIIEIIPCLLMIDLQLPTFAAVAKNNHTYDDNYNFSAWISNICTAVQINTTTPLLQEGKHCRKESTNKTWQITCAKMKF